MPNQVILYYILCIQQFNFMIKYKTGELVLFLKRLSVYVSITVSTFKPEREASLKVMNSGQIHFKRFNRP